MRAPATYPDEPEPDIDSHVMLALAAIAAAADLDDLKQVRLAHAGDRSPINLARRSLPGLHPADRTAVAVRIANGMFRIQAALMVRERQLEERSRRASPVTTSTTRHISWAGTGWSSSYQPAATWITWRRS